jgi:predicted metallo-beta-lactamase superfamily hydrolase
MMTRIESGGHVFVHASDIQLLNDAAVATIMDWRPTTVLTSGPPLYLDRLGTTERRCAWQNARRLVGSVNAVILDHHLMRDTQGLAWLNDLSKATGKRVYCAADFMGKPRRFLEAQREQLYAACRFRPSGTSVTLTEPRVSKPTLRAYETSSTIEPERSNEWY